MKLRIEPVRQDRRGNRIEADRRNNDVAGGKARVAMANPGQSYCSSGDARAHFGLGASGTIDEIRIDWPDGKRETFAGGAADRVVTLNKGSGKTP